MNSPKIILIMPVHNEEKILKNSVEEVLNSPKSYPFSKLLLIENGSVDKSFEIAKSLEENYENRVCAFKEINKGIGYAYFRGMVEALKDCDDDDWIVLSAADMPFSNTDIKYFIDNNVFNNFSYAIGSKAHKDSKVNYSFKRKLMSTSFAILRYFILGMRTKDCQGTIFVKASEAKKIVSKVTSRNFFFSTELTYLAEMSRLAVSEMPVTLKPELRPSSVKPVRDSLAIIREMFTLSKRFGKI